MALYDAIGHGYRRRRRADPRIAARIHAALGDARTILNVGAGAGSYEPRGRGVVAVEPSAVMIRQRAPEAAPVVRASGEALPFADDAFDAGLAVLTIHHWPDVARGLSALRRVARDRVVILGFDPDFDGFWLNDYFPDIRAVDRATMPPIERVCRMLGAARVVEVPVPHDCVDGFLGAYWRRPEAYLEPDVRAAISVFSMIDGVDAGVARLRADLASGAWRARHGELLARTQLDLGYRLIVAEA